ncbi:MAG TPA: hypothetical protein VI248_00475 [Kineosporiaceae bacterium]
MQGRSAGERIEVDGAPRWLAEILAGALAPQSPVDDPSRDPHREGVGVRVDVEPSRAPLPLGGCELITRGVWRAAPATALLENACSAGFDLLVRAPEPDGEGCLTVTARYRPDLRTLAANRALRQRFRLLARQTLVQYPALWRAGLRGGVPVHASAVVPAAPARSAGVLIVGPGGVGKSTLLLAETAAGGRAASDNLCVWQEGVAYGVAEPLRVEGGAGRRTTNGRRERSLPGRLAAVRPDHVVLLRRDPAGRPGARPLPRGVAARALVAGTYAAGELRRYWQFAAVLALATGAGPAHPPIAATAACIVSALPCTEVSLRPGSRLAEAAGAFHPTAEVVRVNPSEVLP